jgi:acyl-CoA thioesterase
MEDKSVESQLLSAASTEPFALKMGIRCIEAGEGGAKLEMLVTDDMLNLFGMCHGGAIFGLIDDAFQIACNSRGVAAYALNLSVTYIRGVKIGEVLTAQAEEISLTNRTGNYTVQVKGTDGSLVAVSQAIAYRKKTPPPFLFD